MRGHGTWWRWTGRRSAVTVTFAVALALVGLVDARAQSDTASDTLSVPPTPPETPDVVPAADIPTEIESWLINLRKLRTTLGTAPEIIEIEEVADEHIDDLDERQQDPKLRKLEELSPRRLDDLQQLWNGHRQRLAGWQVTLETHAKFLTDSRSQLREDIGRWSRTLEVAREDSLPTSLLGRLEFAIAHGDTAGVELDSQLKNVLTRADQISREALNIRDLELEIAGALADKRQRLLVRDSPPIWRALSVLRDPDEVQNRALGAWSDARNAVVEFLDAERENVVLQASAVLILCLFLIFFRPRVREWALEDASLAAAAHLTRRPISAALLIVMLASASFYARAPVLLYDVFDFFTVLASAMLLPGILPPSRRPTAYGLLGLLLFDGFRRVLPEGEILERFFLLLVTIIALVLFIQFVRVRSATRESDGRGWMRATLLAVCLGIGAFAISFFANVFGNVTLAELLTTASLRASRSGVVLLAGVFVVESLVAITMRSPFGQSFNAVRRHAPLLRRRIGAFLRFAAVMIWLLDTLQGFRVLPEATDGILDALREPWTIGSVTLSWAAILTFALVLWAAVMVSRLTRFTLNEEILSRMSVSPDVSPSISALVNYAIVGLGFLLAIAAAGIDLSQFAVLAGALGVGIGFGLQQLVNNFVSGLILIFERPIKVGDIVEFGTLLGTVRRIGIRASVVRTFAGAEVIVPNGNLLQSEVVNWTLSDRLRRVEINVGVRYGSDPNQVLQILVAVVKARADVLDYPEPTPLFEGFGDSSLDFALRFWTTDFENWVRVASEVRIGVSNALAEAGIGVPFPQRDLHVRSIDPAIGRALVRSDGEAAIVEGDHSVTEPAATPGKKSRPGRPAGTPATPPKRKGLSSIDSTDDGDAGDGGDGDADG